jgi:hypothetical protein
MKNQKTNFMSFAIAKLKAARRAAGIIALVAVIVFTLGSCIINIPDDKEEPNTSLDGTWTLRTSILTAGITVSGRSGMLTSFNSTDAGWSDCYNKGYINQWWRNLQSTGNLTWSGQQAWCQVYVSNPNVSGGVSWPNITIVMSANGKTLTVSEKNANGIGDKWTQTYTR